MSIVRVPGVITEYYWHSSNYGMYTGGRVAIFTLTKDRREYTHRMMASLALKTVTPYDHFILDNGSMDGTQDDLMQWQEAGLIQYYFNNQENTGISLGSNYLLDVIQGADCYDWIVKVDNDCEILTNRWLERCLRVMDKNTVLSPYVEGLVTHKGGSPRIGHDVRRNIGWTNHIGGIVTIAHNEAYNDFGRWPVPAPLHGNQDVQFSKKLISLGYEFGYKEDVKCYHIDGTDGQEKKYPEYFKLRQRERRVKR